MSLAKYRAGGSRLQFSVERNGGFFVADFFAEDGTFVQDWAVPKNSPCPEEFIESCKTMSFFIENPGVC
jgi:hypothetical protein